MSSNVTSNLSKLANQLANVVEQSRGTLDILGIAINTHMPVQSFHTIISYSQHNPHRLLQKTKKNLK